MFLYQLRDMQIAALTPFRFWAQVGLQTLENPLFYSAQNDFTRQMIKEMEAIEKHGRIYEKPVFNLTQTKFRGTTIDVKEKRIASHPFCHLIHFDRKTDNNAITEHIQGDPKLLVIPPLSGHFSSILRNTIESMLPTHDVFVMDWIDAKKVSLMEGSFDLEDQIFFLADIISLLGPDVHLLAVTQASFATLAAVGYLATQNDPVQPRSMTLIGGPIDARRSFVPLRKMIKTHSLDWVKENHIQPVPPYYAGAFRPVYPGFLQLQNRMALTLTNQSAEIVKYFQNLVRGDEESEEEHKKLYDEFLATMDVPAELYLQFVDEAYAKCSLATKSLTCKGKKIDLEKIKRTALLTIEAELDDLSPPDQTRAAHDLCTALPDSMKQAHLEIGVGHYGIFSGHKWRRNVQPTIHSFIRKHAQGLDETQ